jgi:hypothetical protein
MKMSMDNNAAEPFLSSLNGKACNNSYKSLPGLVYVKSVVFRSSFGQLG